MNEHDDIINRIEHALDHGGEFIPQGIMELLEDAETEIADLRRQIRRIHKNPNSFLASRAIMLLADRLEEEMSE